MYLPTVLALVFSISVTVSYGHLRLKKFCDSGEQTGTNLTLVDFESDCARACDLNTDCYFMSYHGNECAMYRYEPVCGTGVGATRAIYQVDPGCETGWHRYSGSCYFVSQTALMSDGYLADCSNRGSHPVAIGNAAENMFLTQLLQSLNMVNTDVWIGAVLVPWGSFGWRWLLSPNGWVFDNWGDGEPTNGMNYVTMNTDDGKWQTVEWSLYRFGVCEKSL